MPNITPAYSRYNISLARIHRVIIEQSQRNDAEVNINTVAMSLHTNRIALEKTLASKKLNNLPLTFNMLKGLTIDVAKQIWPDYFQPIEHNPLIMLDSYPFNIIHNAIQESSSETEAADRLGMLPIYFKYDLRAFKFSYHQLKLLDKKDIINEIGLSQYLAPIQKQSPVDLSRPTLKKLHEMTKDERFLKSLSEKLDLSSFINDYLQTFSYPFNKTFALDSRHDNTLTLKIMCDRSFKLEYISKKSTSEKLFSNLIPVSALSAFSTQKSNTTLNTTQLNEYLIQPGAFLATTSLMDPAWSSRMNLFSNKNRQEEILSESGNVDSLPSFDENIINKLQHVIEKVIPSFSKENITTTSRCLFDYLYQMKFQLEKQTSIEASGPINRVEKDLDHDKNRESEDARAISNNPADSRVGKNGFFDLNPSFNLTSTTNEIDSSALVLTSFKP